jgi:hypothetical protein
MFQYTLDIPPEEISLAPHLRQTTNHKALSDPFNIQVGI